MRPVISGFIALGLLAGCASTEDTFFLDSIELAGDRDSQVQQDLNGPVLRGVSVDAKQRFVWSPRIPVRDIAQEGPDGVETYKVGQRAVVCAEPSPDAISALAAATAASASASGVPVGAGTVEGSAAVSQSVSESVQNIGERTQVIQLMRDTLYRACEAYANGALDNFGYALILGQVDIFMVQMLGIDALSRQAQDPAVRARELQLESANSAVVSARAERDQIQGRINNLDAQLAGTIDADTRTSLTNSRNAELQSLQSAREKVSKAEEAHRIATDNYAGALESYSAGRGGAGGINGIVNTAVGLDGANSGIRAKSAACLMWFAQHPQVRLKKDAEGNLYSVMSDGVTPGPAIADFCLDSYNDFKAVNRAQIELQKLNAATQADNQAIRRYQALSDSGGIRPPR